MIWLGFSGPFLKGKLTNPDYFLNVLMYLVENAPTLQLKHDLMQVIETHKILQENKEMIT